MKLSRLFFGLDFFSSATTDCEPIFFGDMRRTGWNDSGVASLSASLCGVSGVSPPDDKKSGSTLRGVRKMSKLGAGGSGFSGDDGRGRLEKSVVWPAAGRRLGNEDKGLEGDSNSLREPVAVRAGWWNLFLELIRFEACCCSSDSFAFLTNLTNGDSLSIGPVWLSQEKSIGDSFVLNAITLRNEWKAPEK
jgi:hypothetical protein